MAQWNRRQGANFSTDMNHNSRKSFHHSEESFSRNNNHKFQHQPHKRNHENSYNNQNVRNHSHRNSDAFTDECDLYFKKALETLKQGIADDQKEVFINNVLEQTVGKEMQLSCQSEGSRLIEVLLEHTSDVSAILRFMKALAENKEDACGNRFASHVTENLLYYGLRQLTNWNTMVDTEKETQDPEVQHILEIMGWIQDLGEFCLSNLEKCLEDEYGCHVLRTLIQVLGGHYMGDSINQSKNVQRQKRKFEEEYLGQNYHFKEKEVFNLPVIPKFFVEILKKISYSFLELGDLKKYAIEGCSSQVLQSHMLVLRKRLPKHSKKFNQAVITTFFENEENESRMPEVLSHKNSSYVMEKLFECCNEEQQEKLWNDHFSNHLQEIVLHPVSNFVVQRLCDVVQNKHLFEIMCTCIFELFPVIFSVRHLGIFASVAQACRRLGSQQAQFVKNIMQCLQCDEPEDRQRMLLPLLLEFQTFDTFTKRNSIAKGNLNITLQGSLVAQSMLRFDKPIKCVRSLLVMKPDDLKYLACHVQGCHILTAFVGSDPVGVKSKDKLLSLIKSTLVPLACDSNGSFTLLRMWVLLSLKQRAALAQEIAKNEEKIVESRSGSLLLKKLRINHFKMKREEWEKFQLQLNKKKHSKN